MKRILATSLLLFLISTSSSWATRRLVYETQVVDVLDGDTIIISNKVFKSGATIRYIGTVDLDGIDAPELDQPGGAEAKTFLLNELKGKSISIMELTDRDKSQGGWVFRRHDNQNVNLLMVKKGLAWARKPKVHRACSSATLTDAQAEAQKEKHGLWSRESPVPPWEWLKEHPPKKERQSEK